MAKEMNKFTELEYKYKADDISLLDFRELMKSFSVKKQLDVSSWDIYYTKGDNFSRLRLSATPELTIKKKVQKNNNWERVEVDLPLNPNTSSEDHESGTNKYLELQGYKKNFKIYKSCFVYFLDNVNFVYYITYDENLKELNRFIEVEVNKDKVESLVYDGTDLVSYLAYYEGKLETIGLTSKNRMKRSIFELYRK